MVNSDKGYHSILFTYSYTCIIKNIFFFLTKGFGESTCNLNHLIFSKFKIQNRKHKIQNFKHFCHLFLLLFTTLASFYINICFIFLKSVFYACRDVEIILIMNSLSCVIEGNLLKDKE